MQQSAPVLDNRQTAAWVAAAVALCSVATFCGWESTWLWYDTIKDWQIAAKMVQHGLMPMTGTDIVGIGNNSAYIYYWYALGAWLLGPTEHSFVLWSSICFVAGCACWVAALARRPWLAVATIAAFTHPLLVSISRLGFEFAFTPLASGITWLLYQRWRRSVRWAASAGFAIGMLPQAHVSLIAWTIALIAIAVVEVVNDPQRRKLSTALVIGLTLAIVAGLYSGGTEGPGSQFLGPARYGFDGILTRWANIIPVYILSPAKWSLEWSHSSVLGGISGTLWLVGSLLAIPAMFRAKGRNRALALATVTSVIGIGLKKDYVLIVHLAAATFVLLLFAGWVLSRSRAGRWALVVLLGLQFIDSFYTGLQIGQAATIKAPVHLIWNPQDRGFGSRYFPTIGGRETLRKQVAAAGIDELSAMKLIVGRDAWIGRENSWQFLPRLEPQPGPVTDVFAVRGNVLDRLIDPPHLDCDLATGDHESGSLITRKFNMPGPIHIPGAWPKDAFPISCKWQGSDPELQLTRVGHPVFDWGFGYQRFEVCKPVANRKCVSMPPVDSVGTYGHWMDRFSLPGTSGTVVIRPTFDASPGPFDAYHLDVEIYPQP